MPQIPQASDYGARPSLQTNRVDRPIGSNVQVADALASAASTFQAVLSENKAKDDRLNYTLARNEIQQADLEARASLAEDREWQKHDEKYSHRFSTARDEILGRYNLSPNDLAVIGSENDLIHAQGRVAVGEHSRKIEIDINRGRYIDGKFKAKISLEGANAQDRNNIILGQLDAIEAQVEAGYMSEEEGATERETMTQDFALSAIEALPIEERIRVIERSLRYRNGYGESLGEHAETIVSASDATGVPPELLKAQISRESSGDPEAKSGAYGDPTGLMQLGRDAAKDMGVTDRTDPYQSIHGGAKYDAAMLERFDGDKAKALAAYNYGPGKVEDLIEQYGDDWLAHAPEETREYVAALEPLWSGGGDKEIKTGGKYKTGQGPLDADAIRRGEGTGSTADFIHADTLAKMLDQAYRGDKENQSRIAAQDVMDTAKGLFPEDAEARNEYIRKNSKGSVEDKAIAYSNQLTAEIDRALTASIVATTDDYEKRIAAGDNIEDIKAEDQVAWDELPRGIQAALENAQKKKDMGELYADRTRVKDPGDGGMSLAYWESLPNYSENTFHGMPEPSKATVNLESAAWADALDESGYGILKGMQKNLIAMEGSYMDSEPKAAKLMVTQALADAKIMPSNGRKLDQQSLATQIQTRFEGRILAEQNSTSPPKELTQVRKLAILNEMFGQTAFVDDNFFFESDWIFGFGGDKDTKKRVVEMTPEELEEAYLPIELAKTSTTKISGEEQTIEAYLTALGHDESRGGGYNNQIIPESNIERAYFALVNQLGEDEIMRRLVAK